MTQLYYGYICQRMSGRSKKVRNNISKGRLNAKIKK